MFRLNPDTLELEDYFTPANWEYVWKRDFDITASAVVLEYKGRELVVIGGKEGVLYLMDAENMGGLTHHDNLYTTPLLSNDDEWFEAKGLWGGFSSYVDARGKVWVYAPTWGPMSAQAPDFPIVNGPESERLGDGFHRGGPSRIRQALPQARVGQRRLRRAGARRHRQRRGVRAVERRERPAVDQRGHHAFRGIQLRRTAQGHAAHRARRQSPLRALDAQTGKALYDSGPDAFETWSHFTGIAVADGQIYAVDFSSTLYCFGLPEE